MVNTPAGFVRELGVLFGYGRQAVYACLIASTVPRGVWFPLPPLNAALAWGREGAKLA